MMIVVEEQGREGFGVVSATEGGTAEVYSWCVQRVRDRPLRRVTATRAGCMCDEPQNVVLACEFVTVARQFGGQVERKDLAT